MSSNPETVPQQKTQTRKKHRKHKKKYEPEIKPISEIFKSVSTSMDDESKELTKSTSSQITQKSGIKDDLSPEEKNTMLVEKIREWNISLNFLEAKIKSIEGQLGMAKANKEKCEIEKKSIVKKISERVKDTTKLSIKLKDFNSDIEDLSTRLNNKIIAKEKLEAEAKELETFLDSKNSVYAELTNKQKNKMTDFSTQTMEKNVQNERIITIKEQIFYNKIGLQN